MVPAGKTDCLVTAPLREIVRERDPDPEDPAKRLRHRARERDVLAVDALREDDDVLVVRKKDDTPAFECCEVACRGEARRDAPPRDRDIGDVENPVDEGDPRILDPVLLHVGVWRDGRSLVDRELDPVAAAGKPEVTHLREVVGVALVRHAEHAGAVAVPDRTRIPKIEAG